MNPLPLPSACAEIQQRLSRYAKDHCEGCRLAWRLKDGRRHVEPVPTECDVLPVREALKVLTALTERNAELEAELDMLKADYSDCNRERSRHESENKRLSGLLAEAKEALEPMARAANLLEVECMASASRLWVADQNDDDLCIGDLRRAAAVHSRLQAPGGDT